MRQRRRIHSVVLQLRRRDRFYPLRMHQPKRLDLFLNSVFESRPKTACFHCHRQRLVEPLQPSSQRSRLVRHRPLLQRPPRCIYCRHVTKSLVQVHSYVDHRLPPSGSVLRARSYPWRHACFHPSFSYHLSRVRFEGRGEGSLFIFQDFRSCNLLMAVKASKAGFLLHLLHFLYLLHLQESISVPSNSTIPPHTKYSRSGTQSHESTQTLPAVSLTFPANRAPSHRGSTYKSFPETHRTYTAPDSAPA